jgi:hypothetical protein
MLLMMGLKRRVIGSKSYLHVKYLMLECGHEIRRKGSSKTPRSAHCTECRDAMT